MQSESHNQKAKSNRRFALQTCARKLARDKEGVTAIEFALVALPFFTVVFAILELGLAFIVNRMVDNAVIEASRMIRTGQASDAGFTTTDFADQVCTSMPAFLCKPERIRVSVSVANDFVNVSSIDSLYDQDGNLKDDSEYTQSNKSEIVAVNVIYQWPMFTSLLNLSSLDHGNERHLSSTMVFRNEPWS